MICNDFLGFPELVRECTIVQTEVPSGFSQKIALKSGVYTGDVNLDGTFDGGDWAYIDAYVGTGTHYYEGDINYDGSVDGGDYAYVDILVPREGMLEPHTRRLYYSSDWQVIEERVGGYTKAQQVWSPRYVDALVLRDAAGGQRHYAQQDANFNVTSISDTAGAAVERYAYDPYGTPTVLDANWAADADNKSDVGMLYLHQGGRYDVTSGLYSFRHREYDAGLGRWVQQDPAGYVDGPNLYAYVLDNPTRYSDPDGLKIPSELMPGGPSSETPAEKARREKVERFEDWYNTEKTNLGWLNNLPDCPCSLPCAKEEFTEDFDYPSTTKTVNRAGNPNPAVWRDPSSWTFGYHPGAKWCMRSKGSNAAGAAQQCCYDGDGKLIKDGPGAGTPDKVSIAVNNFRTGGHQDVDVGPYDLALEIMSWKDPSYPADYTAMYREVRPPNKGKNC